MNDDLVKMNKKIDDLSAQINELKTLVLMILENANRVNYPMVMEIAIFNYITFRVLDDITGKNGPITNNLV